MPRQPLVGPRNGAVAAASTAAANQSDVGHA
jgi:hypothetical protein